MTGSDDERDPEPQDHLTIAPMTREDLDAVIAIERESFPTAWRREAYERELANASARYLVARLGDRLVGYGGMWAIMDEAHITTLAVAKEYRRRGVGERLLVALLETAQDAGVHVITLEVRESNAAARALYEKHSFEIVAFIPGYYADTGEDAVVMWRKHLGGHGCEPPWRPAAQPPLRPAPPCGGRQ